MEKIKIETQVRTDIGKGLSSRIRTKAAIPAILYGKGINLPVVISGEDVKKLNAINFSSSVLIEMEVLNNTKRDKYAVLIKDVQYDPLTEKVLHVDFMKVSLEEKIRVNVPIYLSGESVGAKAGGIIEQILREIELEGLPLEIPQKIEVDISALNVGQSLHVSDVKVSSGLKILTHLEETIVTVVLQAEEEAPTTLEGAAPVEPEVIREKKELPTEEGAENKDAKDKDKDKEKEKGKEKK